MKGKFLKCFLVLFAASFLFLGAGVAQAAYLSGVPGEDKLVQEMNTVSFWAIDNDYSRGTNYVGAKYFVSNDTSNYLVKYSVDNITWNNFNGTTIITTDLDRTKLVYLALFDQTGSTIYDRSGTLYFLGTEDIVSDKYAYDYVGIEWDTNLITNVSLVTDVIPKGGDFAGTVVPLPATVWLLGAGVMAIVGIRRKSVA